MKALVLAASSLIAFAAPAFAQDTTPAPADNAPAAPTTTIQRGDEMPAPIHHAKHHRHHETVSATPSTQHSGANLNTEVRPRAATATPTPGSSVLGNRSDDPAGPTTVITR